MKRILLALGIISASFNIQAQTALWALGTETDFTAKETDVTHDGSGNVIMSGFHYYTSFYNAAIGGTTLTGNQYSGHIVKLDQAGDVLWTRITAPASGSIYAWTNAVAADQNSNAVYAVGAFAGSCAIGSSTVTGYAGTGTQFDGWLAKLDSSGNVQWVRSAIGPGVQFLHDVSVDGAGNVYVAGSFQDTVTLGSSGLGYSSSSTNLEHFVAKYNSSGALQWVERIATQGSYLYNTFLVYEMYTFVMTVPKHISLKNLNSSENYDVVVTGNFSGSVTSGASSLSSTGSYDGFLVRLSASNGNTIWLRKLGGTSGDFSNDVAVDQNNNIYITGSIIGTATFDSLTLVGSGSSNRTFLAKYDELGTTQWITGATASTSHNMGLGVSLDSDSNVYVAGRYASGVSFGSQSLSSSGSSTMYLARYNQNSSSWQWAFGPSSSSSSLNSEAFALSVRGEDDVYTVGRFNGNNITLGSLIINNSSNFTSSYYDGYILRIADCSNLQATVVPSGSVSFCSGESLTMQADTDTLYGYQWLYNGSPLGGEINSAYTTSNAGNYSVVIDSAGCVDTSTVVAVSVNALPNVTHTNFSPVCDGEDPFTLTGGSPSGGTYSGSGVTGGTTFDPGSVPPAPYTIWYSYTDANGCSDSVSKTLQVYASPLIYNNTISACESDGPINLAVWTYGTPTGGTHSGNGVSGNLFYPSVAGPGTHVIYYVSAFGCEATDSIIATVTASPNVNLTAPATACNTSTTPMLLTGTPSGGTFTWNSINSQLFYPFLAGTGNVMVTYSVTQSGCTAIDTEYVFVDTVPTVLVSALPALCEGDDTLGLLPYGNPPGGNFSGTGVASNVFNPATSGTGTFTLSYTYVNGCGTYNDTESITVNPTPSISISSTNVSCFGGNDGAATATGSGTTSPYTYAWSSGATTASATGLVAGTYTVTVTDNNGCQETDVVSITEPTPFSALASSTSVSCNGGTDGALSAFPSGGTSPYTYLWSNGSTTSIVSVVAAGTYTITITDDNGCTATASTTVTQPAALIAFISGSNVSCNGGSNGSATASATGGTSPYTYAWSGGGTSATKSSLSAGTYTVTVTDNNGCTDTETVTITEPTAVVASISSSTNVSCNGGSDGSATASGSGGTSPYTYAWSGGGTSATKSGLIAGTYTVTLTDANGCTDTETVTISQPATAVAVSITSSTNASCNGGNDGAATANATGGTGTKTYAWSNGGTTASITGLSAGSYTVTATDANGCTDTETVSITEPTAVVASIGSSTNVSCNGGSNGSATASATGGTSPYTYAWSGGGTSATKSGLSAGTYTVTITDANGCTDTETVTITEPTTVVASISSSTNVGCNGGNSGSATASASGGTSPYTYAWSGGGTSATKTGLSAGTYTVTITDANGCTDTETVTITEPTAVVVAISSSTNVSCNGGSDGSATASGSGGTSPYTYAWSGGGTSATISSLSAGTYTVTVTDANGCTDTETVSITEPASAVIASITSSTNVSCNGGSDGAATATASGGTGTITYAWSNGGTTASITGLIAGTYTVTATDANACTDIESVIITEPTVIVIPTLTRVAVSCNGGSDGTLTANPTGGTPPYAYLWTNGNTTQTATGLSVGTYTVTVTDANGCTKTKSRLMTQPTAVSVSITAVNVSCNGGSNGSATASATGGTGAKTYSWSTGGTTATITGLSAGTYTVTATDTKGCTDIESTTITEPTAVIASIATSSNVSCNGGNDGSATAGATGGTSPYSYAWSSGAITASSTSLSAGTFTVTVSDANGCTDTETITITQPASAVSLAALTSNPVSCNGGSDGSATVGAGGGTSPYSYAWSSGSTTASESGLSAGTYTVTATDANGCTDTTLVTITEPTSLVASASIASNVSCNGGNDGSATASATGGTAPYTYAWSGGGTSATKSSLSAGTYTVTITDANGCSDTASVAITEPSLIVLAMTAANVSCNGLNDGSISVAATGGTAPYSYLWSTAATISSVSGLSPGNYTVTVTDANGCTVNASQAITQPVTLSASVASSNNVSCFGGNNGSATASASGGTTPYTYLWSSGATSATASTLTAGNYTVTITDANGCTDTESLTITEPSQLNVTATVDSNTTCASSAVGVASAAASGGVSPYSYAWSSGSTTAAATGLGTGIYMVTVTDANNCTDTTSISILVQDTVLPVVVTQNISVSLGSSGSVIIDASMVDNGSSDACGIDTMYLDQNIFDCTDTSAAVTVTLTVVDVNGNTASATAQVTITDDLPPVADAQNLSIYLDATGSASITAAMVDNGSIDNCSIDTMWLSNYDFDCADTNTVSSIWLYVQDVSGNIDSASALITVTDSTAPIALTQNITVYLDASGAATATASMVDNGSTDNCSIASMSLSQTSFDCGDLGVNSLDFTLVDASGNITTAQVQLTVEDTTSPVVTANDTTLYLNASGQLTITAAAMVNTNDDNCAIDSLWLSDTTFTCIDTAAANAVVINAMDASGNTSSATFMLTILDTTAPVAISIADTTLYLGASGTVTLMASAVDSGSYDNCSIANTFLGQSTFDCSDLGNNSVTFTAVDASGNTSSTVVLVEVVDNLTAISINIDSNLECYGDTAAVATATATGYTAGYSYLWSDGQTTATASGLSAGTYYVTATSSGGCSIVDSVTFSEPTAIELSLSAQEPSCNGGNDAYVASTVSGGTPGYSYEWNTGSLADSIGGITAGFYELTVSDANGCTAVMDTTLDEPLALAIQFAVSDTGLCTGDSTASASAIASGGTAPYGYAWNSPSYAVAMDSLAGMPAGTYLLTITDNNGCLFTDSFEIEEFALPSLTFVIVEDTVCSGLEVSLDSVTPAGGQYFGNGISGDTLMTASLLGTQYVMYQFTDANGCINSAMDSVHVLPLAQISFAQDSLELCAGEQTGLNFALPSGGVYTSPFIDGETLVAPDTVFSGLGGWYVFENSCGSDSATFGLIVHPLPVVDLGNDTMLCNAGTMTLDAGNHAGYLWSNGDNASSIVLNNGEEPLTEDLVVWVTVNSDQGCTASDSIFINVEDQPVFYLGDNIEACLDSVITLSVPDVYDSFIWSNGSTALSIMAHDGSVVMPGVYEFWVTGTNEGGCSYTDELLIRLIDCDGVYVGMDENPAGAFNFEYYPNPASDKLSIRMMNATADDLQRIVIFGAMGEVVRIYKPADWSVDGVEGTINITLGEVANGVYLIQAQHRDGVSAGRLIIGR